MIHRITSFLYRLLLRGPIGAEACADLEDGYQSRRKHFGSTRALLWYVGHLLSPHTWQLAARLRRREGRKEANYEIVEEIKPHVRFAVRSLRRSPLFAASIVATIALCLTANAAVLSSIYSLILRPLPFENSDRLVQIVNVETPGLQYQPGGNPLGYHRPSRSTWLQYKDFEDQAKLFDGFAFRTSIVQITATGSVPVNSPMHGVSAGFFDLMRVEPVLGRFFFREEMDPGHSRVIVLTQSSWEGEYGADPAVLGREVRVGDGVPYTIVGVAPRSMEVFDFRARYFIPYLVPPAAQKGRVNGALDLWARLKDGVSREAALAELRAIENRWYDDIATLEERGHHDTFSDHLDFGAPHPLQGSLVLLQIGALLVLFVGAFNVLTLLLARATQRSQELSIRVVLGARRATLRSLMVVESALLSVLGLVVGLALTAVALRAANSYLAILSPSSVPIALDPVVVAGICVATLCGVCLLSLIPLGTVLRPGNLAPESMRAASVNVGSRKLAGQLVIIGVAHAFTLLIGAGLLVGSFFEVSKVDVGFDSAHVVSGMLDYNALRPLFANPSETIALKRKILEGMRSIPGVEAAAVAGFDPPRPNIATMHIEGTDVNAPSPRAWLPVSTDYFEAMGMSIREGRSFDPHAGLLEEVIVDESFGPRYLGGRSPVGTRVMLGAYSPTAPWSRIVGVVTRVNLLGQEQRDGAPVVYTYESEHRGSWTIAIVVRSGRTDGQLGRDAARKLHDIDPRLPRIALSTFKESNEQLLVGRRGMTTLLGSFAILALLVAIVGLYAVLSLDVVHRERELAIRAALGASPERVIGMVLRDGLARTGLGLSLGTAGAAAASVSLRSLLFDVAPFDPTIYGSVAALFLLACLIASYVPARRAAQYDALSAFR
jgi:putative ABC transport system permease protein